LFCFIQISNKPGFMFMWQTLFSCRLRWPLCLGITYAKSCPFWFLQGDKPFLQ
jgi:hypothetical protein